TIVNVALPDIKTALGSGSSTLVWIVSGYALAFGLVLVPAGRLGDRIGHKRTFVCGLAGFTIASAACGLAQSSTQLVAARAVQGLAAGFFYPAITATVQLVFSGRARSRAFGILGATIGVSTAAGPIIGGLLIEAGGTGNGWRWVFLVNVVIGIAAVPLAARLLPPLRMRRRLGFDPVGLSLLALTLLLLMLPLAEGETAGWPPWTFASLGGACAAAAGLALWERTYRRRGGDPVLSPDLLSDLDFTLGAAVALVYFAGFSSIFLVVSILWQTGLDRSALQTGLTVVPFSVASLIAASQSSTVSGRMGRWIVVLGSGMVGIGLVGVIAALHRGSPDPSSLAMVVPLLVAGAGNGLVIAPNQDFVLRRVPREKAGTAGGLLQTAQRVGSAVGIAAVATVLFGTLAPGPGFRSLEAAFTRSAQLALIVDVGLVAVAFGLATLVTLRER
ncbi:MAG TPA: MFS transporter, partial [Gaiellales bacterium]|nr:MFS transporter [Gaiellales bacterium]